MVISQIVAAVTPTVARSIRRWIVGLGGIGLIPLGLLDNSLIPSPGGMDLVLIILCAREPKWWLYYALMATAGAIVGGFVTYRLSRKGGEKSLEQKFPRWQVDRVNRIFERWGFGAIAISAVLPPPVPVTPFLIAAGALQYPAKNFLAALSLGRIVRYTTFAYLGARYGRKIIALIREAGNPLTLGIVLALIGTAVLVFFLWRGMKGHKRVTS